MRLSDKAPEERFLERFKAGRGLRLQMTLILLGVCLSGPLFSKLLLLAGLHGLVLRYALAVAGAYLVFFLLVKGWLYLVLPSPGRRNAEDGGGADWVDGAADLAAGDGGAPFLGRGGRFDGAGATVALDEAARHAGGGAPAVAKGTSGSSGSWDFDLDKELIVVFVLLALLAVIFGAAVLLVWQAPVILSEAALQAALAMGLVRRTRQGATGHWSGGVLRATWKPFALVLVLALILGWTVSALFPGAEKLSDVLPNL